jgi:hypothetical protein
VGESVARVHEVAGAGEAAAEASAGVKLGEAGCVEAAAPADFEGERVAEREHDGGGGGGREVEAQASAVTEASRKMRWPGRALRQVRRRG